MSSSVAITVIERSDTFHISPTDDLRARVDAADENTTFLLAPGTHHTRGIVPKNGMTFVGRPGAIITGDDRTPYAFSADSTKPLPHNVVIKNLVIEHFKPPLQSGAIKADFDAAGWIIDSCEVRYNAAGGIRLGPYVRVTNSRIHHNAQIGILGGGDGIVIEGNEIAYNNPDAKYDMYWEAGGTKFAHTRDLIVRTNFVHHNHGPGLWTDIDNIRTLYENNRVEDNAEAGIFHEISYVATIRNNVARRNGTHAVPTDWVSGAGILVNSSSDVEIVGNTVEDNRNGIVAIEARRGDGTFGAHLLRNLWVHDNTVRMNIGVSGIAKSGFARLIGHATQQSASNRFENNRYQLGKAAKFFRWGEGRLNATGWQKIGQDSSGTFSRY